jgi:integrase
MTWSARFRARQYLRGSIWGVPLLGAILGVFLGSLGSGSARFGSASLGEKLRRLGIEEITDVTPHGLRRTYASLRFAVGDDPVYTAAQLGHEDPTFTIRVYAQAVKRRERLTPFEREQYDLAVDWAQMGVNETIPTTVVSVSTDSEHQKGPALQGLH